MDNQPLTYKSSGVDIEAGERAVELMKASLRATYNDRVLTGLSDFGGMYALDPALREPVLVSSTDGVGTKLKIAFALDRHGTVGQDLVAMVVDDVVVQGARPLFMLDYLAVGRLRPEVAANLVRGMADACRTIPCALIGGETAELPGFYAEGEYDLAGFAVGVVERERIIDGSAVRPGDVVLGLASSGLHSNGYSLARAVLLERAGLGLEQEIAELGRTLGAELLEPTVVYAGPLCRLFAEGLYPHALAHITGGGIAGNLARVLPAGVTALLERSAWPVPPVFPLIQRLGDVAPVEMDRAFNLGLGMIVIAGAESAEGMRERLQAEGLQVHVIGEIVARGADEDAVLLR
jgi:phosphoribosylformylglycinamidine cyclo-ligase